MNVEKQVRKLLSKVIKLDDYGLSKPPNPSMGDLSSSVSFIIAKKKNENPKVVAQRLAKKIKPSGLIREVKAAGPYINFFLDKNKFAEKVVNQVFSRKGKKSNNKTISLDFYGPNALKGIHVGHVRNASVGGCLSRVLKYAGFKVKVNSFGCDIGLPVAKVIWGYMDLGLKPEGDKGEWLGKVYAVANSEFNNNEQVKQEVYEINKRLYDKEKKIMRVYDQLMNWSYDYVKRVQERLRLRIDEYTWESGSLPYAKKVIDKLKKEGIAVESEGALIIDLKKYKLGVFVLLTNQEVPTYGAKDLGLYFWKKKLFRPDKFVIFTGSEQVMHFNQLIKTLELLGEPKNAVIHKPYEIVDIEGQKISSRLGNVLLFNELMSELVHAAKAEVIRKNPSIKNKDLIANEVALSSVFYGMIKHDLNKKINFRIEDWVRFDGDTGAYLQYSFVRANKILKGRRVLNKKMKITKDEEHFLVSKLNDFESIINESVKKLDPSLIARHAFELSNVFNKFYEKCPVLMNGPDYPRLRLVKAFRKQMSVLMELMGMKPLSEM